MQSFKKLKQRLNYLPSQQIAKIEEAYLFAAKSHGEQKRSSGELYITHPLAVAITLATMHMDYEGIMAALLHDVVEDTPVTKEELAEMFGDKTAMLVDGVTKLTRMRFASRAEMQAESFRKTILAMSEDIRVILIKLADRFHNAQTLIGLPQEKINRVGTETLEIYAPIAQRLGMHILSTDLENLCFKAMYPWRFKTLQKTVAKLRKERKKLLSVIEQDLQASLGKSNIEQALVFHREKHLYGIYKSMNIRKVKVENILRKYSFRIVVDSIDSCYRALGIVHGLYKPIPGKFKDYIAIPKVNGYQSLHTTLFGPQGVPVEIQIRTQIMEHRANYGIAAHWIYQQDEKTFERPAPREQKWINNLLEIQQNTAGSLELIENIKNDLFPNEVYVFTPKGKIIELPRGATIVDFAYTVHTDIGNHCKAAKINDRFVPLSTTLRAGQTVSILTEPDVKPNPSWLNFVMTSRARSGIRNFLKTQLPQQTIQLGKTLLEDSVKELGIALEVIPSHIVDAYLEVNKLPNIEALYHELGLGNRFAMLAAYQLFNSLKEHHLLSATFPRTNKPYLVRGKEGSAISFAPCCYPVPGDPIVGHFPLGKNLIIHSTDCPKIIDGQKKDEQYLEVDWARDITDYFSALIMIEVLDQRGSLALLAQTITKESANIEDVTVEQKDDKNTFLFVKLSVHDLEHLNRIIRHILNLPIVINVTRNRRATKHSALLEENSEK